MLECNEVKNLIVPGTKLKIDEGERVDATLFKQIVGSLMYITNTRHDLQIVVSLISRFMANPMKEHYDVAKRVMRYIQGTLDFGIWYKRGGIRERKVFANSDYAGNLNDKKSTSGYLILWDGAAVTRSSKKQSIIVLSSTEAEYVAAAACACQVIWVQDVLREFGFKMAEATPIHCDYTSAIKLSNNLVFHGKCKHIGVRHHFLRDLVNN